MTYRISPPVSDFQRNLIIGTILGGSSIIKTKNSRNCYLSMRDSDYQWLFYKGQIMEGFTSDKPFNVERIHRWHSICYPIFNEFRNLFFSEDGKRKLHHDDISELKDVGLAIWFADAGTIKNDGIIYNTSFWGEEGSKEIVKYFECIGMEAKIIRQEGLKVKLSVDSSIEMLKLYVRPILPEFFKIDIPYEWSKKF